MILDADQFDLLTAIAGNPDALMTHWLPDRLAGPAVRKMFLGGVLVPASAPTGWRVTEYGQRLIKHYSAIIELSEARYA